MAAKAVSSLLKLCALIAVAFNSAGACCRCTAAEEAQGAAAGPVAHVLRRPHQVRPGPDGASLVCAASVGAAPASQGTGGVVGQDVHTAQLPGGVVSG